MDNKLKVLRQIKWEIGRIRSGIRYLSYLMIITLIINLINIIWGWQARHRSPCNSGKLCEREFNSHHLHNILGKEWNE